MSIFLHLQNIFLIHSCARNPLKIYFMDYVHYKCYLTYQLFVGEVGLGSSEGIYFVLNTLNGYSLPSVFLDVFASLEVKYNLHFKNVLLPK